MAIFLSLLTAALFGSGDFVGGLAAKRTSLLRLLAGSHVIGFAGSVVAAVLIAEQYRTEDLLLGAASGIVGVFGLGLLYRRLSIGPMGVVAPLSAITSAAVPAIWGTTIAGESLTVVSWSGVALALCAIGFISWSRDDSAVPITAAAIFESLLAGVGFGFMFVILSEAESASAPWPIAGARLASGGLLVLVLLAMRRPILPPDRITGQMIVGLGVLDTSSNAIFLYAVADGDLTIVAVLSALYPAATVILARVMLDERLSRLQVSGLLVALTATVLIAAG